MNRRLASAFAAFLLLSTAATAAVIDGRAVVVIDGDTFALPGGERIRLVNVDAPESFRPRCERERIAGLEAKARLAALVRARQLSLIRSGRDRYGRTLAYARVQGRDIGTVLVAEGLALPWHSGPQARAERLRYWCGL